MTGHCPGWGRTAAGSGLRVPRRWSDGGGYRVVESWNARQECERFLQQTIMPMARQVGIASECPRAWPAGKGSARPRAPRQRFRKSLRAPGEGRPVTRAERDRVREEYRRRETDPKIRNKYTISASGMLYSMQQGERMLLRALRDHDLLPLRDKRILDVGCGGAGQLLAFHRFGAVSRNLFGVDLFEPRLVAARAAYPGLQLAVADASELPFPSASFDLVTQFTMFSSILDAHVRRAAAREMRRVLRPSGAIIWYDFYLHSPWSATQPQGLTDIRNLFPSCRVDARRVTLLPPIARALADPAWELALLVEHVPLLRSHYLAVLRPAP
jgi:ubiquinone/menaquinone biosynthesis C-methylase UbiE